MTEISVFLDIPEITVIGMERTKQGNYNIFVTSTTKGTHCRKCGKFIDKFHGYDKEIVLRHLPISGLLTLCKLVQVKYYLIFNRL